MYNNIYNIPLSINNRKSHKCENAFSKALYFVFIVFTNT